jgi:uncharacterized protein
LKQTNWQLEIGNWQFTKRSNYAKSQTTTLKSPSRQTTRAQVECDRCLKTIELPVSADFALEYITGAEYESNSGAAELTEAEMSVSVFDGEAIGVDEVVKEQILLAVPTRMLCREDCNGICPECGTDLNAGECKCFKDDIDPRWAALKNLT